MDYAFHKRKRSASRGQALVPVIFVLLILTSLAITFAVSSHREIKASANFDTQSQRQAAELGAINYAMSALDQSSNHGATYGKIQPSADTDANGWMPMGNAWVKMDAVDTASMIDLNTVTATTLNQLPIVQQNPDLASTILDWRTTSTTPSTNGAKSEYYNTLTPPYDSKNGPYDSVEELLLVKEVTPQILYGTPGGNPVDPTVLATLTTQTVPSATNTGSSSTSTTGSTTATTGDTDWTDVYNASQIPLAEMFTTTVWERNVAADGTPRININKAAVADLTGIGLSTNLANALLRYRTGAAGGTTGTGTTTKPGGTTTTPTPTPKIQSVSRQAKPAPVTSTPSQTNPGATTGGTTGVGGAAATAFTSLGDLLNVAGFTATVMQQIADQLSIDANAYHADMVNINTASPEVLAAVPGMDHTTVAAILTYRQGGQAFQSMGDFYTLQLSRKEFQNVVGKLCTKSSFYRIRVRVRMPGEETLYAAEALVQLTENGPQIVQWKEVQRSPGYAYWAPTPLPALPTPTPPSSTSSSSGTTP